MRFCLRHMRTHIRVISRTYRDISVATTNSILEKHNPSVTEKGQRKAKLADKHEILSFRKDLATSDMDYLEPNIDFYIQDRNRVCLVGALDNKLLTFNIQMPIDAGKHVFAHSLLVHEQFEGTGVVGVFLDRIFKRAEQMGFDRLYTLVDRSQKATRRDSFKRAWVEEQIRIQCTTNIARSLRARLKDNTRHVQTLCAIKPVNFGEFAQMLTDGVLTTYLFSSDRMLVNFISYRCILENVPLLPGQNTTFYSTLRKQNDRTVNGLLSVRSWFKYISPQKLCYIVDIFGCYTGDVQQHIMFHINEAFLLTDGDVSLHVVVENEEIAKDLRTAMTHLGIPSCNIDVTENAVFSRKL